MNRSDAPLDRKGRPSTQMGHNLPDPIAPPPLGNVDAQGVMQTMVEQRAAHTRRRSTPSLLGAALLGLLSACHRDVEPNPPLEGGCRSCHGGQSSAAPPKAVDGSEDTASIGVGAHQAQHPALTGVLRADVLPVASAAQMGGQPAGDRADVLDQHRLGHVDRDREIEAAQLDLARAVELGPRRGHAEQRGGGGDQCRLAPPAGRRRRADHAADHRELAELAVELRAAPAIVDVQREHHRRRERGHREQPRRRHGHGSLRSQVDASAASTSTSASASSASGTNSSRSGTRETSIRLVLSSWRRTAWNPRSNDS